MNTTTLRGVFPEPKPVHRRNFIKENVKQIKQMQGLLQDAGIMHSKPVREPKPKLNVPRLIRSRDKTPETHKTLIQSKVSNSSNSKTLVKTVKPKVDIRKKEKMDSIENEAKVTHRSMQTERTEDIGKLYETGVIKYPSPNLIKPAKLSPHKPKEQGDIGDEIDQNIQNLDLEEKDYIKENMKNFKPKTLKQDTPKVPAQPPPNYQRGVVPKYLRDRKEDDVKVESVPDCPPGHVLLPEEERKETLRVLRQSYADRIQELNSMPVRNDTLRMRRRKMEIEEELKRIDGGIKVFQRPKVFVKINA